MYQLGYLLIEKVNVTCEHHSVWPKCASLQWSVCFCDVQVSGLIQFYVGSFICGQFVINSLAGMSLKRVTTSYEHILCLGLYYDLAALVSSQGNL
jgi:hypothetical protein